MKAILTTFLALSLMAGPASQSRAATPAPAPLNATANVVAVDYDNPAFGTQEWWRQQEDRGG